MPVELPERCELLLETDCPEDELLLVDPTDVLLSELPEADSLAGVLSREVVDVLRLVVVVVVVDRVVPDDVLLVPFPNVDSFPFEDDLLCLVTSVEGCLFEVCLVPVASLVPDVLLPETDLLRLWEVDVD